jgi:hypothetical protein
LPLSEVETNDYNLNIPRYVDTFEEEEIAWFKSHNYRITSWLPIRQMQPLKVLYRTRNRNPILMMNKYNQVMKWYLWRFPSGSGYALQSFVRASQKDFHFK